MITKKHIKANKIRQEQHVNDCKLQAKIHIETKTKAAVWSLSLCFPEC